MTTDWDREESTERGHVEPTQVQQRPAACLVCIVGTSFGQTFPLTAPSMTIGRVSQAEIRIPNDSVSRAHARVTSVGDGVYLEDLNSANGTYINGTRLTTPTQLRSGDKIQVGHATILKFTYQDSLDDSYQKQIFDASLRDGLTNIFNARYIMDRLNSELQFAMRQGSTLGMILFDIDHLKRVNEAYGRASGDRALFEVAQLIARSLRTEDVVARYGGDELIVLMRGIPRSHVLAAADRLRQIIHKLAVDVEVAKILLSVSAGVATYPEAAVTSPMEMVGVANQALYRAKQNGRNRVEG